MSKDKNIIIENVFPYCDECPVCCKMVLYDKETIKLWTKCECPWCGANITLRDCIVGRTGPVDKSYAGRKLIIKEINMERI